MTSPYVKVVRDFWRERTRTLLVVLAIAVGIAGFAAVLSSYAILTRELDRGYLATNPASATLRTDAIDDALVQEILSGHGVSDAEPGRVESGRIKAGPAEWRNLVLFVVRDFGRIRISRIEHQEGAWPPATGEILIERDALQVARAEIGDTVTVRTSRGRDVELRLAGSVKDVGQAQARMENIVYGYITLDTLVLLGEEPYLDRIKILVAEKRFDESHVRSVAADVRNLLESRGHPVRRLDIPEPGKHPHSEIMGLLLLTMAGFGFFVLLLSGIIVVNLLTALMASEIRQIGVMKAIGGSRGQIARVYFSQALLLGLAALITGVPAGMIGGRLLCRYFAVFLNFDINSFAVPVWVFLLVAAVGIVVPLLAAAWPVWRGSGMSVREALADYGTSRNTFGATALDRALSGVGGFTRPLLLAIRNSFRRRTRLALTVLTLTMGGLCFISALNIRASLIYSLDRVFATKKYDLTVNLGTMQELEKAARAIGRTPGVKRWEGWIASEGSIPTPEDAPAPDGLHPGPPSKGGGGPHGGAATGRGFAVIAHPAETVLLEPEIIEGRGLQPGDTDAMVVNTRLAERFPQFKVGRSVEFRMGPALVTLSVVGLARESFSPLTAYVPLRFFEERGHSGVTNALRLDLESADEESIRRVRASLDENLEEEGIRPLGSASIAESRFSFDQHMLMIYVFLIIMSGIIAGVGGLGLVTTMSLNVLERRREMGILRAIGARPRVVMLIVVAEGVMTGLLSWVLALATAWPVSIALGNGFTGLMFSSGLDFVFEPLGLLIWLGVSLILGAAASFLSAWRASRLTVREALAYE